MVVFVYLHAPNYLARLDSTTAAYSSVSYYPWLDRTSGLAEYGYTAMIPELTRFQAVAVQI